MMRAALLVLAMTTMACANAPAAESARDESPIASLHHRKCGSCHVPVEPGARTRAELEPALARHEKRVKLTRGEWDAMLEYLASSSKSAKAASPTEPR
jgi:hypothetical protein